jgi:carnitine O-acetyltransferase
MQNLAAIAKDADKTPVLSVAQNAIGLLTTENRKIWSGFRTTLIDSNKNNERCLAVVDSALFVVCLDDDKGIDGVGELCANFLCGGYEMENGVQVGTCTNRW